MFELIDNQRLVKNIRSRLKDTCPARKWPLVKTITEADVLGRKDFVAVDWDDVNGLNELVFVKYREILGREPRIVVTPVFSVALKDKAGDGIALDTWGTLTVRVMERMEEFYASIVASGCRSLDVVVMGSAVLRDNLLTVLDMTMGGFGKVDATLNGKTVVSAPDDDDDGWAKEDGPLPSGMSHSHIFNWDNRSGQDQFASQRKALRLADGNEGLNRFIEDDGARILAAFELEGQYRLIGSDSEYLDSRLNSTDVRSTMASAIDSMRSTANEGWDTFAVMWNEKHSGDSPCFVIQKYVMFKSATENEWHIGLEYNPVHSAVGPDSYISAVVFAQVARHQFVEDLRALGSSSLVHTQKLTVDFLCYAEIGVMEKDLGPVLEAMNSVKDYYDVNRIPGVEVRCVKVGAAKKKDVLRMRAERGEDVSEELRLLELVERAESRKRADD
ncbi:hypothetical protein HFN89_05020 [Rhizobium laguerreae]|nr:hypothetical protein [Rhizobium laguerreae]